MSDAGFSEAVGARQEHAPAGEISAGTMMRNAREASGLHVAALAVSMKIPVKKLEALESDRLDLLHDAVFVRALAASVCRALKIDPAPILNKLPLNSAPRLSPDERGINAPFHSPNDATGMAISELLAKPSTFIVLALLVAGIAVYFFPDVKMPNWYGELSNPSTKSPDGTSLPQVLEPSAETTTEPVSATTSTQGVPYSFNGSGANEVVALPPAAIASTSLETPTVKASASVPVGVATSQPVFTANRSLTVASVPSAPASIPGHGASSPAVTPILPPMGLVVFKAKGSTWVKVVDAKGVVQLSKTIVDGEVVGASGTVPLSIVIGRADVTDVEVRGKPFVLLGVSKDNVARFEVK